MLYSETQITGDCKFNLDLTFAEHGNPANREFQRAGRVRLPPEATGPESPDRPLE